MADIITNNNVNREASEEVRNVLLYDITSEPCYKVEFSELFPNIKDDPDLPTCERNPCISKPMPRKYTRKEIRNFVEEKKKDSCIRRLRKPIYRYSCTECDFLCIDKSKLPSHWKMMHPDSSRRHIWKPVYKYPCTECEFISIHKGELSSHMKKVHKYKCSFCDAILNCRRALERHKEGVHDQIRMHECNQCGHFFDSPQNIRRHQKVVHLGLKEYICKYCDYRSSSNQNLRLHIQRNHERSMEYKCQECDFKTNAKPNLLTHQKRMHSHKAEYRCNICFFSCKSNVGDTDSIMINSNSLDYNDVFKLGAKIKTEVNKMYKLLELEVDGVFRYMLLLKKKKYAAVTTEKSPTTGQLVDTTELKGLDVVRRDWSSLASNAGKEILNYILSPLSSDERISRIHEKLENLAESLNSGQVPLTDLAIIKQLTKDPEDYPDKKSLPHVQVALRMNSKSGGKKLRAGDTISFVICDDGSNLAATQRAYHIDEVRQDSKNVSNDASGTQNSDNHINHLKIDIHYYLAQQLHPVISRLCDPLDGTDSARIAQCLGLDPEQFRRNVYSNDANNDEMISAKYEERFRTCEKFEMPPCKECGDGSSDSKSTMVDSPVRNSGAHAYFAFTKCPNMACNSNPLDHMEVIQNKLTLKIREHIKRYYKGWVVCEDPGCSGRTRQLPLSFQRAFPICETCRKATMYMEYTDSQLYLQLLFYQYLFDTQRVLDRTSGVEKDALKKSLAMISKQVESGEKYKYLKLTIDKVIQENNYSLVSLNKVFDGYFAIKAKDRFGSEEIETTSQNQPMAGK